RLHEIKQPKRRETLIENAGNARVSLKLVQLDDRVPLKIPLDHFAVHDPEPVSLIGFLKAMEFFALSKRAASHYSIGDADAIPPAADPAQPSLAAPGETAPLPPRAVPPVPAKKAVLPSEEAAPGGKPGVVADRAALFKPIDHAQYETVITLERLHHWMARAREQGHVCIDTQSSSPDAMRAKLCGISLAVAPGEACYIPCAHRAGEGLDLAGGRQIAQLSEADILERLKPLFEDAGVLKIGQNLKYDYLVFLQHDIRIAPCDD